MVGSAITPYATIAGVRSVVMLTVLVAALAAVARSAEAARKSDPLIAARQFYNAGQFDRAIDAATEAAANPSFASAAHLVLGRSRLERYRKSAAAADLESARTDLRAVDPRSLDARERIELQVGLGLLLYFDEKFGAAAALLQPLADTSATLAPDAHERALEWWATSLDRQAQAMDAADRAPVYARVIDRMEAEQKRDVMSPAACYWLAAAARGSGDLDRAWASAEACWVRSSLAPDRGAALRADLDKLVTQAIIPEKGAKVSVRERRQAVGSLTTEWENFKKSW
jgi:hypothetical protein